MNLFKLNTSKKKKGIIKLDPRTLLFLLLICNLAVFFMPSVFGEIILMTMTFVLAMFCGTYGFSVKLGIAYLVLLLADYIITICMGNTFMIYIALGLRYTRKVFPCAMLGGVLITTTRVGEILASLTKMHVPKTVTIPLTVLLRYFPSIGEDRRSIKKAMSMRGLNGGFFKHPARTIECLYVPLLMSASRRAEELSSAAVTRGIENPKQRTSVEDVRFHVADFISFFISTCIVALCIWGI